MKTSGDWFAELRNLIIMLTLMPAPPSAGEIHKVRIGVIDTGLKQTENTMLASAVRCSDFVEPGNTACKDADGGMHGTKIFMTIYKVIEEIAPYVEFHVARSLKTRWIRDDGKPSRSLVQRIVQVSTASAKDPAFNSNPLYQLSGNRLAFRTGS